MYVRRLVVAQQVSDSYFQTLREALRTPGSAEYFVIDMRSGGEEWLTSRLYLFSYLLGRLKMSEQWSSSRHGVMWPERFWRWRGSMRSCVRWRPPTRGCATPGFKLKPITLVGCRSRRLRSTLTLRGLMGQLTWTSGGLACGPGLSGPTLCRWRSSFCNASNGNSRRGMETRTASGCVSPDFRLPGSMPRGCDRPTSPTAWYATPSSPSRSWSTIGCGPRTSGCGRSQLRRGSS